MGLGLTDGAVGNVIQCNAQNLADANHLTAGDSCARSELDNATVLNVIGSHVF